MKHQYLGENLRCQKSLRPHVQSKNQSIELLKRGRRLNLFTVRDSRRWATQVMTWKNLSKLAWINIIQRMDKSRFIRRRRAEFVQISLQSQVFAWQTFELLRTQQTGRCDPFLCFNISPLHHRLRRHHHRPLTANIRHLFPDDARHWTPRSLLYRNLPLQLLTNAKSHRMNLTSMTRMPQPLRFLLKSSSFILRAAREPSKGSLWVLADAPDVESPLDNVDAS